MIGTYEQATEALYGRINYELLNSDRVSPLDFKLDRMRQLLAALDDPHLAVPAVHVAGTKGKGTVCGLVANMLQTGGYSVGLYTSPHMYRFEERFVVNGELPSPDEVVALTNTVIAAADQLQARNPALAPTFFECVNAMAWLHFRNQQVDLVVLEVGLGGRLDSTNLCAPLVTAITSISYDHTRILGSTLSQIASEKAGIIKPDVPVICGVDHPEPQKIVHETAAELNAPVRQLGRDILAKAETAWTPANREQQVNIESDGRELKLTLRYPGSVYADNAAIAVGCLQELTRQGFPVEDAKIAQAVRDVELPLRFEILEDNPLLIADSAHNAASIRALLKTVREHLPGRPITLMLAISGDKDRAAICRELTGVERVVATRYVGTSRSLAPTELADALAQSFTEDVRIAESPADALELGRSLMTADGILIATGSLFFAAEIRQLTQEAPSCTITQSA